MSKTWWGAAIWAAAIAAGMVAPLAAAAAEPMKIGVILPLTGNSASAGQSIKDALELGAEIVNTPHAELKATPLAGASGRGLKIELDEADHQGNPEIGQQQTTRLIMQDHVAAMLGAYHSSVALAATAVAERQAVPFLVADSVAPSITTRSFKFTFRTAPVAADFGKAYAEFINAVRKSGLKLDTLAIVNENTDYGIAVAESILDAAKAGNINIAAHIVYDANSPDLSPQVLQLKAANPDAVIFISYTADSILFFKTMRNLDYLPPMIIGDDAGFSDPAFIANAGDLAQGVLDRSVFDIGRPGANSFIVNKLFHDKYGRDLDETGARWMQGLFVLADALNRAGSTDAEKIREALNETELKAEQLMVGYKGVKFDANGQNALASTFLMQLKGNQYVSVWPEAAATDKLDLPMKGWR
jgi:branched-chain amino acid transport system substrate-binding protein